MRYLLVLLVLAGCGPMHTGVPPDSGLTFTVEHRSDGFQNAQNAARRHCFEKMGGLHARHTGTDRLDFGVALSRFECFQP